MKCSGLCLAFLPILCFAVVYSNDPDCTSDTDCGEDHCCVFVNGKYGSTICQPLGQIDDTCRPNDTPLNMTVRNGPLSPAITVRGVHYMLCPCRPGLQCSSNTCLHSLPLGSESHPSQVPQGQRLPPGSESHPSQVPRRPQ